MLPATANAPRVEPAASILAAYTAHLARTGRGNISYQRGAAAFLQCWPDVSRWADLPLNVQLRASSQTRPFVTFLMVSRRLAPGYDYLVARKLSSLWRDLTGGALEDDLRRFVVAAGELGFSQRQASSVASQIVARLLIATGRDLDELTAADLDALAVACRERQQRTGRGWKHYKGALHTCRQVLFHLQILTEPAAAGCKRLPFEQRLAAVPPPLHEALVAYLKRKNVTCVPGTVSGLATG